MSSSRLRSWALTSQQGGQGASLTMQEAIAGDHRVLRLKGELDLLAAPALEDAVERICDGEPKVTVVLDLSGLGFLDSSGLRAVLEARDRCARAGCDFRLIEGPHQVQRVFQVTGLEADLPFQAPR